MGQAIIAILLTIAAAHACMFDERLKDKYDENSVRPPAVQPAE